MIYPAEIMPFRMALMGSALWLRLRLAIRSPPPGNPTGTYSQHLPGNCEYLFPTFIYADFSLFIGQHGQNQRIHGRSVIAELDV